MPQATPCALLRTGRELVQSHRVLTAVRRRAAILTAIVYLSLAVAAVVTVLQPTLYAATGSVVLSPLTFLEPDTSDSVPALADTIVAVAESPVVLRRTATAYARAASDRPEPGGQVSERWLRDHLTLRPVGTSNVVEITATGDRPDQALMLASSEVASLAAFVAQARIRTASLEDRDGAGLRVVTVSDGAAQGRVSPTPLRNGVVGLIGGLIVGCAVAVLVDGQRRRGTPRRLAAELRVPWLGTVTPGANGGPPADSAVRRFLECVEASQRPPGHVALITGSAPREAIAHVAGDAVRSLNATAKRALLLDGNIGPRAMTRRLRQAQQSDIARERPGALLDPEARGGAMGTLWPEYEFVVISGPSAPRAGEVHAVVHGVHSLVLAVAEDDAPEALAVVRALAHEATAGRAAVGVVGVGPPAAHANNSS